MENLKQLFLLEGSETKSMKFGLESMKAMDNLLGMPSKQFASVQVAGTNGKGSVTTKIAAALQANGKKVGLYTSPHIHSFHERIKVNGLPISDEKADKWLEKILASIDYKPSYFELLTLLAFCYFAEQRVDFAVLEVGMGGRLDATNIVSPVLSVITSIDMDHAQYLGNTLEAIAFEKAGIIKAGIPALIGPHVKPLHVFESVANSVRSPLFQVLGQFEHYELENQAIARKALSLLPFPLEKKSIDIGLATVPSCRFEIVSQDPVVVLDVAHNPDGMRRAFERLRYVFAGRKFRVVAGFSADKAIDELTSIIHEQATELHLAYVDHVRLRQVGDPIELAFENAYLKAKENNEILLVCGTFFIMHHTLLKLRSMQD